MNEFIVSRSNDRDVKFIGEVIGFSQSKTSPINKTEVEENIESYTIYKTKLDSIVIERKVRISDRDLVMVFGSSSTLSSRSLEVFGFNDLAKEAYTQAGLDHYEHA